MIEQALATDCLFSVKYYEEWARYDETPMPLKMRNCFQAILGDALSHETAMEVIYKQRALPDSVQVQTSTASKKLLQCEEGFGFIVHIAGKEFVCICRSPSPLQVLESEKAPVLTEAIIRSSGTSRWASLLDYKSRTACVDGHASNFKSERTLQAVRKGWLHSVLACEDHLVAGLIKDSIYSTFPAEVKGLLWTALATKHGEHIQLFRECLYQEVVETLDIVVGPPTPSAVAYRKQMLDLYFTSAGIEALVWANALPNGDWRDIKNVFFHCSPDMHDLALTNKPLLAHYFALGMLKAFLPCILKMAARHHWTGFDVAVDQQGGMEACHGLFSRTTRRFLETFEKGKPARRSTANSSGTIVAAVFANQPLPIQDYGLVEDAECNDPAAAPAANATAHVEKATDVDWVKENIQRRSEMQDFWITCPLGRLNVIRLFYEPARVLMKFKLETGGMRWELRQRAKVAKAVQQCLPADGVRDYRILLAAGNLAEDKCYQRIRHLLTSEEPWGIIMEATNMMTVAGRALAFLVGSKEGASVEELRRKHQQFPYRTFLVFKSPEIAEDIVREVRQHLECAGGMIDEWTLDFVRRFPTADALRGPQARSILLLRMLMLFIENGAIESLHAWVRRLIVVLSAHTHPSRFTDVNASWMFGRQRNMVVKGKFARLFTTPSTIRRPQQRSSKRLGIVKQGNVVKQRRKGKQGGGGAFRCWVRQKLWKCATRTAFKPHMKAITKEYWELPPEAKARLQAIGRIATHAHKFKPDGSRSSSFGPRSAEIDRAREKEFRDALQNRCLAVEDALNESEAVQEIASGEISDALRAARMASRSRSSARIAHLRADLDIIERFDAGEGARALRSWSDTEFSELFTDVAVLPSEGSVVFELAHSTRIEKQDQAIEAWVSHLTSHIGGPSGGIRAHLEFAWEYFNAAIMEKDVMGAYPDIPPPNSKCHDAGLCLCTECGRRLSLLREEMLTRCVKSRALPHTQGRQDLKAGQWLLQLQGYEVCSEDAPVVLELSAERMRSEFLLHIALQVLSPWRSTYQLLERAAQPFSEAPASDQRMYTKTSAVFEPEFRCLNRLDKSLIWTGAIWKLEMSLRPIPSPFSTKVVGWTRFSDPVKFWPPSKKIAAPRIFGSESRGSASSGGAGKASGSIEAGGEGGGSDIGPEDLFGTGDSEVDHELWAMLIELGWDPPSSSGSSSSGAAPSSSSGAASSSGGAEVAAGVGDGPGDAVVVESSSKVPKVSKGAGEKKYPQYPVYDSDGTLVGTLLVNTNARSIDAHCCMHGGECSVGRTYIPYEGEGRMTPLRSAKGRCVAYLVAWLRMGRMYPEGPDYRPLHFNASKCKDEAEDLGNGESSIRVDARCYVESAPDLEPVRTVERKPRPGEPLEPLGPF